MPAQDEARTAARRKPKRQALPGHLRRVERRHERENEPWQRSRPQETWRTRYRPTDALLKFQRGSRAFGAAGRACLSPQGEFARPLVVRASQGTRCASAGRRI